MESSFTGVMALHGIYTESDMPGCLKFMRNAIAEAREEK